MTTAVLITPQVRVDIIGTTFTRGIFSNRHDTATRQAFLKNEGLVTLFDNTNADYQRAINAYVASEGLYYPAVFDIVDTKLEIGPQLLPLLKCRAQRYAPDKMLVTALYQRTPGTDQPNDPFATATFRGTDEQIIVYRSTVRTDSAGDVVETNVFTDGLPGGDFLHGYGNLDETKSPTEFSKPWKVSGLLVYVAFQFTGPPPLGELESFRNTINDEDVLFLGETFGPFTVYFEGYDIDTSEDGTSSVLLTFKLLAPGWVEQHVIPIKTGDPPVFLMWATTVVPEHPLSDFTQFPL